MATVSGAPTLEHHREPLGIGDRRPRVSFKVDADPSWTQVAYELEVTRDGVATRARVDSPDSVLVPWPGEDLVSRERASLRVRVVGREGDTSPWSAPAVLEAGLLEPGDWHAVPVGPRWPEDHDSDTRRPPLVRREFAVPGPWSRARLYVSAHGLYEVELNGRRVGREAMAPGWTVYGTRLEYATYDVTSVLHAGTNVLGAWLGDGWYRGRLGWNGGFRNLYGRELGLIAQLEILLSDGRRLLVATDDAWRAHLGPILSSGIYDGEDYDARAEMPGWSSPGFDDRAWSPVAVFSRDPATLVAPTGPPVRCSEQRRPVAALRTPAGKEVLDFGQNLVGRLRIRVSGAEGAEVVLSTAEVLQDGEIYTRPLRGARSTDRYILAGRTVEEWEPRFTLHGFRYVQVDGWPGDLGAAAARGDIVACVYHSDMERTGWFSCSDADVNRLHENVVWSMRGNFVDIPTDCPQRDERVGWTGDLQVFAPTATFLYDCSGVLDSWLRDVAIEQLPDGTVPWYVPVIPAHKTWTPIRPGAVWGDVAVLTPFILYERFGDAGFLERQYESAKAWVDLVDRLAGADHLWDEGFQLGDWLDPSAPPQDPARAMTDPHLVATAYFFHSATRLADAATVLGRDGERDHYRDLAAGIRRAFVARYVTAPGQLSSDSQSAYALALCFGLLPESDRAPAGARLAELVRSAGDRIATGFAGTPVVCDALCDAGKVAAAYDLLLQRECPSWLYAVSCGATTIWERWDALLADGTVNPGTMTSFNHYAFGAVGDWLHRVVAGLAPVAPGYREILFRPRPGGTLTSASARHESPYGTVAISWQLDGEVLDVEAVVPTGTRAVLDVEACAPVALGPGHHRARRVASALHLEPATRSTVGPDASALPMGSFGR